MSHHVDGCVTARSNCDLGFIQGFVTLLNGLFGVAVNWPLLAQCEIKFPMFLQSF